MSEKVFCKLCPIIEHCWGEGTNPETILTEPEQIASDCPLVKLASGNVKVVTSGWLNI